jgi:hypothetical protein
VPATAPWSLAAYAEGLRKRWPTESTQTNALALCSPSLGNGAGDVIVPVFKPPGRIDAGNVAGFVKMVDEFVDRYGCMVIDCSEVGWIATIGMCVLDRASNCATITLVNPSPTVHLMAATFATDVRLRYDRVAPHDCETGLPRRRLMSVHPCGKVAG